MSLVARIAQIASCFSELSGRALAITPLALIFVQFLIIVMSAIFHEGSIKLQESLQYINALMFLGGAGYTLKFNEHVRVDLFYSKLTPQNKDRIDFFGTLFLLLPFVGLIWITAIPFVVDSWSMWETSVESSGLPFIYLLKSTILLFALSLTVQAIANLINTFPSLRKL